MDRVSKTAKRSIAACITIRAGYLADPRVSCYSFAHIVSSKANRDRHRNSQQTPGYFSRSNPSRSQGREHQRIGDQTENEEMMRKSSDRPESWRPGMLGVTVNSDDEPTYASRRTVQINDEVSRWVVSRRGHGNCCCRTQMAFPTIPFGSKNCPSTLPLKEKIPSSTSQSPIVSF